jgi:hypothetical protein
VPPTIFFFVGFNSRPFRGIALPSSPCRSSSCFWIYVTASEVSHLFGPGKLRRLLFTSRPSELQLNRQQRIRELLHLSRLADAHSVDEFRNPTSPTHQQLVDILQRLAR